MYKKINILLITLFLMIFVIGNISAWMPTSHKYITIESTKDQLNSELFKACVKYPSLCYAGNVLTDVSVQFYWLEGKKYELTHASNFARALIESANNDKEYACAVGVAMHQANDLNSHNEMVPYSIKHSFLVNYVIHVFSEQKVDNYVQETYPGVKETALLQLSDYQECLPLFKRVMLGDKEYSDLTSEQLDNIFAKFITEIQTSHTGYDTAFKTKSFMVNFSALPFTLIGGVLLVTLFFILLPIFLFIKIIRKKAKVRHYIALVIFSLIAIFLVYVIIMNGQGRGFEAIITIAKPISNLVPIGESPQTYLNEAIDNTKDLLNEGTTWLNNKDASGLGLYGTGQTGSLIEADRSILVMDYVILFSLLGLFIWYIWYLFKKNKVQGFSYNL